MTGGDRRRLERCPICQGPTRPDAKAPMGIRCLNSLCRHNHPEVCERCQSDQIHISYKDMTYHLSCSDCYHKWTKPDV